MTYPPLIPYLVVSDAAAAIDFYKAAFGAIELTRHTADASPQISHAHLLVNGGSIMLSDDILRDDGRQVHGLPRLLAAPPSPCTSCSRRCGRLLGARRRRRSYGQDGARRSVLGRPLRSTRRPLRPHLVIRSDEGAGSATNRSKIASDCLLRRPTLKQNARVPASIRSHRMGGDVKGPRRPHLPENNRVPTS